MHAGTIDAGRAARVGISGSYGGLNLGDEAILQVILAELRRTVSAEVTVFSRDAADTRRRHAVERVVQHRDLTRGEVREILEGLDLFILGGGGILYDADAGTYLREVLVAHDVGIPVMVYGVGVGPLQDRRLWPRIREALEPAAVVTVRDHPARRLLEEVGVEREVLVTADPALLLEPEPLPRDEILRGEGIDPDARLIGFSVREPGPAAPSLDPEHYHALIADAADFLVDRLDAQAIFVPLERRMFDVQHGHRVIAAMAHARRATVLKREYTPGQILSLLSHFRFAVGMRLHFLIFAALAGVPFVGMPYVPKVQALLDDLRVTAPALEHLSSGRFIAHVDRAWDERERRRAGVEVALGALQSRARRNGDLAAALLSAVAGEARGPTGPHA